MTTRPAYGALVGRVLARRRRAAGLSQGDVGRVLGTSQSAWSKVERGASVVNAAQLYRVCRLLRVRVGVVIAEADELLRRSP